MRYVKCLLLSTTVGLVACREKWDVKNYAENIAETTCARAYDCCTETEIQAVKQDNYGKNQGDCEDKTADILNFKEDKIERGIDKARLVYHGSLLKECLANYAKLTCDDLKTPATADPIGCDGVLVPLVNNGGRCDLDEECLSGNCEIADDNDGEGTCQDFVASGDACGNALTCGAGTYCASTCVPTKDDGTSCNNNFECTNGGCNGLDTDNGTPGSCGQKGGADSTCFLVKGCMAAEPELFLVLALVTWLWRRRVVLGRR